MQGRCCLRENVHQTEDHTSTHCSCYRASWIHEKPYSSSSSLPWDCEMHWINVTPAIWYRRADYSKSHLLSPMGIHEMGPWCANHIIFGHINLSYSHEARRLSVLGSCAMSGHLVTCQVVRSTFLHSSIHSDPFSSPLDTLVHSMHLRLRKIQCSYRSSGSSSVL